MSVRRLQQLEKQYLADGTLTGNEAKALVESAKDFGAVSREERAELKAFLGRQQNRNTLEPEAKSLLESFLNRAPAAPAREPLRSVAGANPASFADDVIYLGEGTVHGEAGVPAYTRGYDATKLGPLRRAHGSKAPPSSVLSPLEQQRVRAQSPGAALDAAARAWGVRVDGFEKLAHSKDFYNPSADFWWGKCHAWAWAALDSRINAMVDVPGPEGAKGVWIGGQWLSRADLGNWMMAVADTIALSDANAMFDTSISATDLLKGTSQFMMNGGGGVVADIFNDGVHGHKEVWNQPFVAAEVTSKTVRTEGAKGVLALARGEGVTGGVEVKHALITGTYADEASDHHEGAPKRGAKHWNVYAVVDADGKVLTAWLADDPKLKGIRGLPTRLTDEAPEYFWKPKLGAIDDVLAGRRNEVVEGNRHGKEFKFFVGTVLTKGVPGTVRTAFEAEVAALPRGRVDARTAEALANKYPGVANAYSAGQWNAAFAARGLVAKRFGASWPG